MKNQIRGVVALIVVTFVGTAAFSVAMLPLLLYTTKPPIWMMVLALTIWLVWLVVAYLIGKFNLGDFRKAILFLGALAILALIGIQVAQWLFAEDQPALVSVLYLGAALLLAWLYPLVFWGFSLGGGQATLSFVIFGVAVVVFVGTQLLAYKRGISARSAVAPTG